MRRCPGSRLSELRYRGPAGREFCDECGSALGVENPPSASAPERTAEAVRSPTGLSTELRHVSVLFCDLVGFTPFSEKRDPEEVREVLSGYFELARAIVGRYGGVVQKFIGDAVMAVWGAPVAKEDDAERAVRAGLELISAVAAYGSEQGTELQARVGVVTGGAATTETPEEGLVIGDRVNTAARIQSAAPPGCCYVDETTRAATAAAIAYSDAGEHALKGKSEPVRLFQATRVVAATAGSQRSGVLEAPFTGRDHELRLVKELFHASAERRSARLVLVTGVAGIGKSRLAWEFFKYIDGLAGEVLWHSRAAASPTARESATGRCRRWSGRACRSARRTRSRSWRKGSPPGSSAGYPTRPTASSSSPACPAARGSHRAEPRTRGAVRGLAHVLRAPRRAPAGRHRRSRTCSGRTPASSISSTTCSTGPPTTPCSCSCSPGPRGPTSGASSSAAAISPHSRSSPSPTRSSASCSTGSSPTSAPRRARIVGRAEGIPLYAIETVRSLLDRGVLEKGDDGLLHLVGELGELEIPPGLTALIASRLDALAPEERRVVKECAVLGESFPRQAIEAVSDADPGELDEILHLARAQGDPHRPGRQALARARPVRLHTIAHPVGRIRHVDEGRA